MKSTNYSSGNDPVSQLVRRLDAVEVNRMELKKLQDIKKELYPRHPESERQFKKAGQSLTYIPWHEATRILDSATGGHWEYQILRMDQVGDNVVVAVRVTLHALEGTFSVDGQGVEDINVRGYGDPFSNAESMAYRRACAKLGLGLYLYKRDKE